MRSIFVHVHREPETLALRYMLAGDLQRLRIPAAQQAARTDGLWRHTCFELFVQGEGERGYREFNFSPSGEWAAYAFTGHREGGSPLGSPSPTVECRASADGLELRASAVCPARGRLQLGLCAVIEGVEGALCYWALRHATAKPDFHHAGSFALEVDEARY